MEFSFPFFPFLSFFYKDIIYIFICIIFYLFRSCHSCPTYSQLDDCGDLNVAVGGSNWDLLRGKVKRIEVSAKKAVYKVLTLSISMFYPKGD